MFKSFLASKAVSGVGALVALAIPLLFLALYADLRRRRTAQIAGMPDYEPFRDNEPVEVSCKEERCDSCPPTEENSLVLKHFESAAKPLLTKAEQEAVFTNDPDKLVRALEIGGYVPVDLPKPEWARHMEFFYECHPEMRKYRDPEEPALGKILDELLSTSVTDPHQAEILAYEAWCIPTFENGKLVKLEVPVPLLAEYNARSKPSVRKVIDGKPFPSSGDVRLVAMLPPSKEEIKKFSPELARVVEAVETLEKAASAEQDMKAALDKLAKDQVKACLDLPSKE